MARWSIRSDPLLAVAWGASPIWVRCYPGWRGVKYPPSPAARGGKAFPHRTFRASLAGAATDLYTKKKKDFPHGVRTTTKVFSVEEVGLLYRLRCIELLFKEWKSYANLHRFDTSKENIAEGLIWASLLAATIKRTIAQAAGQASGIEISTLRVAACARHFLDNILKHVLCNAGRGLYNAIQWAFNYIAQNATRAHPSRDRKKGRLQAGLRHVCIV